MKRGFINIFCVIVIIILGSKTAYTDNKKIEPEKIIEALKKYPDLTFPKRIKIKKKITSCLKVDQNPGQAILEAEKLLDYYLYLDDYSNFFEQLNLLSYCYRQVPSEYQNFIGIMRAAIDTNILNSKLINRSDDPDTTIEFLLGFSVYSELVNKLNEPIEKRWKYDKKILDILLEDKKNILTFESYVIYSELSFGKPFVVKKLIKYITKAFDELIDDPLEYLILADIYLDYLRIDRQPQRCIDFYNKKLSQLNYQEKHKRLQVQLINADIACKLGLLDIYEMQEAYNYKIQVIEDALKNYTFNRFDSLFLKRSLIRTLSSTSHFQLVFNFNMPEAKKILIKAKKLNEKYLRNDSLVDYIEMNSTFLDQEEIIFGLLTLEDTIFENLELIEKLTIKQVLSNGDIKPPYTEEIRKSFQLEVNRLKGIFLFQQALVLRDTGRVNQSIESFKYYISVIQEIINEDEINIYERTKPTTDLYKFISAHSELFKIYSEFNNYKLADKHLNEVNKICENRSEDLMCLSTLEGQIEYYQKREMMSEMEETYKKLDLALSIRKWNKGPLTTLDYMINRQILLTQFGYNNYMQSKALEKGEDDKYKYYRNESCKIALEHKKLFRSFFSTDEGVSKLMQYEIGVDISLKEELSIHDYTGILLMVQHTCDLDFNDEAYLKEIKHIIEIERKTLNTVKISHFSTFEFNSKTLSNLVGIVQGLKHKSKLSNNTDAYNNFLALQKELFSLSQFGKSIYLTNLIKLSLSANEMNNKELVELLDYKSFLIRQINIKTKEAYNTRDSRTVQFNTINKLKAKLNETAETIKNDFPKYHKEKKVKFYTVEDIQKNLGPEEALIVFNSLSVYFGYIITKENFDTVAQYDFKTKKIRFTLTKHREHLNPYSQKKHKLKQDFYKETLGYAYDAHFKPLEKNLINIKKIVFVSDNNYADFPIGAMYDKVTKSFVAEKFSISYYPTIGSFVEIRKNQPKLNIKYTDNFLGIGNPTLQNKSIKNYITSINDFEFNSRGILKNSSILKEKFANLPFSEDEINNLANLFEQKTILVSKKANEEEIKMMSAAQELNKFDLISFATHAAVSGDLDGFNEPFLVLTPPKQASVLNDGVLSASEISGLDLNAKIVILSACNTASKINEYAPGFSGLVASFFEAGTKSILATHWPISDKTSSIMINKTIKKVIDKKIGLSQALQETKIEFINGKYGDKYKSPVYWASYVIIGD